MLEIEESSTSCKRDWGKGHESKWEHVVRIRCESAKLYQIGRGLNAHILHRHIKEEECLQSRYRRYHLWISSEWYQVEGRRADHDVGDRVVLWCIFSHDDLVQLDEILLLYLIARVPIVQAQNVVCSEVIHVKDGEQRVLRGELYRLSMKTYGFLRWWDHPAQRCAHSWLVEKSGNRTTQWCFEALVGQWRAQPLELRRLSWERRKQTLFRQSEWRWVCVLPCIRMGHTLQQ